MAAFIFGVLGLAVLALIASQAQAVPEGPSILFGHNETKNASNGTAHTAGKGTINFVTLNQEAQNMRWKAYVGNITGTMVLQDTGGYNIYDWKLTSTLTGNIIASRNTTLNWSGLKCLNFTALAKEQSVGQLDFSMAGADNINRTFNDTNHTQFTISTMNLNGCPTTYTFQSAIRQPGNSSANVFQEIAIQDDWDRVGYATRVHSDILGYRNDSSTVDFQLLIPDFGNLSTTSTATYYFFVELT